MQGYGIQFSIGADAYKCDVPEERLLFGDCVTDMQCGKFYNWQDIILDGKIIGYLQECLTGKLLHPITVSFIVPLADCMEHELWDAMASKCQGNPHLFDAGECLQLRFATLQQMINYLNTFNAIC